MTGRLPAAEPRRTRGGAAGVRPNRPGRRSEQTVWIPEHLYRGSHFPDEAVVLYAKVAALDARRSYPGTRTADEPCTASVTALATACGVSKSVAERGLRALNQPGPDGAEPWLGTRRRTHRGGTGRTAYRQARLVPSDAPALQVPVTAAEALTPRLFRAYLHLRRAQALGLPVTAAEIAGELYHHTGTKAGHPLGERTGRRILLDLDRLGWISLGRRAGYQGRHLVTVNGHPVHPVHPAAQAEQLTFPAPGPAPATGADTTDGSGADDQGGSLASKEDSPSSTDVVAQVGGGIRRRRGTGSKPVDNHRGDLPAAFGGPGRGLRPDSPTPPSTHPGRPAPYTGPGLQLSPRVWNVLAPVRHLLPGIRPYLLRRIAHAIGRQLDTGTDSRRLTARLTHRYASTVPVDDPGRWILGAGLPRHGCGLTACESGVIWHTGARCHVCLDNALHHAHQQRPSMRQSEAPPAPAPRPADLDRWTPRAPRPESTAPALTRAQKAALRADATPDAVRAAIDLYGQAAATDLYGHALVFPHLTGLEGDAREAR